MEVLFTWGQAAIKIVLLQVSSSVLQVEIEMIIGVIGLIIVWGILAILVLRWWNEVKDKSETED